MAHNGGKGTKCEWSKTTKEAMKSARTSRLMALQLKMESARKGESRGMKRT